MALQFEVTVNVFNTADGQPLWGYSHTEVFPGGEDAQQNALDLGVRVLERIDEAHVVLRSQIATDAPLLCGEQDADEEPRTGGRRHG